MSRFITIFLLVTTLATPLFCFAEFTAPISGKVLQRDAILGGGGLMDERRGSIGRNSGQKFTFYSDEVYQIRVISYYFQPVLKLWDNYGIIATSTNLEPKRDEYGRIYAAEIVFYPDRDGDYFLRTESAHRDYSSGRHSVYVYQYRVDWPGEGQSYDYRLKEKPSDPVKKPIKVNPSDLLNDKPKPSIKTKSQYPCECPSGFVHYYGTICVGDNAPIEIDCRGN